MDRTTAGRFSLEHARPPRKIGVGAREVTATLRAAPPAAPAEAVQITLYVAQNQRPFRLVRMDPAPGAGENAARVLRCQIPRYPPGALIRYYLAGTLADGTALRLPPAVSGDETYAYLVVAPVPRALGLVHDLALWGSLLLFAAATAIALGAPDEPDRPPRTTATARAGWALLFVSLGWVALFAGSFPLTWIVTNCATGDVWGERPLSGFAPACERAGLLVAWFAVLFGHRRLLLGPPGAGAPPGRRGLGILLAAGTAATLAVLVLSGR